ncbi:MAG: class II fructose-1,6-bisphosphate aldolase [Candidatus Heimdallarchaeota archaeon]|nr:class II fructose-1,6-bisphosphate aldolase [Candidatus Heimdallarchaeota archaeon]
MVHYKEIGFVNTKEMFKHAMDNGYAVPAYNFNNMEQIQAIVLACVESRSPVILQVSKGARKYANQTLLRYMAEGAVEYMKELGGKIPMALHLDHGDSFELCKSCVDMGFSSVMYDGCHHSYEENIKITKEVVEYAHKFDASVEAELGVLAGIEEHVSSEKSHYTKPEEVKDFVTRTGCDSLAISIGTSHGAFKFKPGKPIPPLRFDILEEIQKKLPGYPIVLHGSSSVPQEYVEMVNQHGGDLSGALGVPEDQLRKAASMNVCKINIDSDGRLVVTAVIRKVLAEQKGVFDPRKYLGPARDELKDLLIHKNKNVLGSANRY